MLLMDVVLNKVASLQFRSKMLFPENNLQLRQLSISEMPTCNYICHWVQITSIGSYYLSAIYFVLQKVMRGNYELISRVQDFQSTTILKKSVDEPDITSSTRFKYRCG